ncbi:hypothetical protein WMF30_53010 [Sorangium sp. So ce134]
MARIARSAPSLAARSLAPLLAGLLGPASAAAQPAQPVVLQNEILVSRGAHLADRTGFTYGSIDIAASEEGYFAAWSAVPPWSTYADGPEVHGVRLDKSGRTAGLADVFTIGTTAPSFGRPFVRRVAVAAGRSTYLAAWSEDDVDPLGPCGSRVRAALFWQDELEFPIPTTPDPIALCADDGTWADEAVAAFDGSRYLVLGTTWEGLYGTWVDEDGIVSEETVVLPSPGIEVERLPSVACGADGCLVVWVGSTSDRSFLVGARVGSSAAATQEVLLELPVGSEVTGLDVVADGEGFLLAWSSLSWADTVDPLSVAVLHVAAVDADGKRSSEPVEIPVSGEEVWQLSMAGVSPGQSVMVWYEPTEPTVRDRSIVLRGVRLTTATSSIQPSDVVEIEQGNAGHVACVEGDSCLLLDHADPSNGVMDSLFATQLTPELDRVGDPNRVTMATAYQLSPAAACGAGSDRCLVVWRRSSGEPGEIAGAFVSSPDAPLVLADPEVAGPHDGRLSGSRESGRPSVVSGKLSAKDPDRFLAAWLELPIDEPQDELRLSLGLVGGDGSIAYRQLPSGVRYRAGALHDELDAPALAFDGTQYLVVWSDADPGHPSLWAARVTPDGVVVDGDRAPLVEEVTGPPAVVHDGAAFLVVWRDAESGDLLGAHVDGAALDRGEQARPFRIAETVAGDAVSFGLASDGKGTSLVVLEDGDELRAMIVNGSGVISDTGVPFRRGPRACCARVAFDGTAYLVVWSEEADDAGSTLRGVWIRQDGTLVPEVVEIAGRDGCPNTNDAARAPALASRGDGRALVAFTHERFVDARGGGDEACGDPETGGYYYDTPHVKARLVGNPCELVEPRVACAPSTCRSAGACDPATRTCVGQLPEPDGAACRGGLCFAGECVPDPPSAGEGGGGSSGAGEPAAPQTSGGGGCHATGAPSGPWPIAAVLAGLALRRRARRRRPARSTRAPSRGSCRRRY